VVGKDCLRSEVNICDFNSSDGTLAFFPVNNLLWHKLTED
jgi:hypothetical protein